MTTKPVHLHETLTVLAHTVGVCFTLLIDILASAVKLNWLTDYLSNYFLKFQLPVNFSNN